MIHVIGNTLPVITAIMISPIPLAGLIVVITSKGGSVKSVAYGMGFFAALWLTAFLLACLGQKMIPVSASAGTPSSWGLLIHGALGATLLIVGCVALIKRFNRTLPPVEPKWMKTLDSASMLPVFGLGGLLALVNPKNLPLIISATVDYAQANLSMVQLAIVVTALATVGSLLIILPIVFVHLAPKPSAKLFDKARPWLVAHNTILLAAICLIVGALMLGRSFGGI